MSLPASKISPTGNYRQQPNKALISTRAFNSEFFSYSTYVDSSFNTRGTLAVNSAATVLLCPAGRVLHANGKILNTGVNPDLTVGGTTYNYLMGVLDPVTGLNGYINPASATFANYDTNLPVQYDGGNLSIVPPLGGQGAKLEVGPVVPRITITGTISNGQTALTVTATTGRIVLGMLVEGTNVQADTRITSQTSGTPGYAGVYAVSLAASGAVTSLTGTAAPYTISGTTFACGDAVAGQIQMPGTTAVVTTNSCTATSIVILTLAAGTATSTPIVSAVAAGTFTITGLADQVVNFLIVN